jgi:hypothetical protein
MGGTLYSETKGKEQDAALERDSDDRVRRCSDNY